ncbi:LysR family transcriptional regulator [Sphingomonas sp.]|uniref:LysR family transcriptional regulator n=1 Tax=Sphingomonas sp. TaxID=28214 RepID=UPI0035C82FF5
MKRLALYHFETLLAIDRLGTFAAAAAHLNTTQPAISARVRELETQLGTALFQRRGRRMVLTAQGRRLVREGEPLWSALERMLVEIGDATSDHGVVRIGSGEIVAASCLPGFLTAIKRDLPGVLLEVTVDLTARMLEQLLAGESDLVFLAGPVASPGIVTRSIGAVRPHWLAAPEVLERMTREKGWMPPLWSLPGHSPLYRAMTASLERAGLDRQDVNTCNNVRALIEIIVGGGGLALLPDTMTGAARDGRLLCEVPIGPVDPIIFQAAVRAGESDRTVLKLFERTGTLTI